MKPTSKDFMVPQGNPQHLTGHQGPSQALLHHHGNSHWTSQVLTGTHANPVMLTLPAAYYTACLYTLSLDAPSCVGTLELSSPSIGWILGFLALYLHRSECTRTLQKGPPAPFSPRARTRIWQTKIALQHSDRRVCLRALLG